MTNYLNLEHIRFVIVSAISPILGYFTPTGGFVTALVIMFGFNIWAGMRADGVAIVHCKNFSFSKFKNALWELLLYLLIMEVVFSVMERCGDIGAAILAVKSLTYVFLYVYLQNGFKNLISAYPRIVALRVIYHVIRFEFKRAMPSYIQPLMERLNGEFEKAEKENENVTHTGE